MTRPRVLNKRTMRPDEIVGSVYVGRPSRWGNPYIPGRNAVDRQDAIDQYREWLMASPDRIAQCRAQLQGKHLVCWCAPLPCHADVLLEIANSEE